MIKKIITIAICCGTLAAYSQQPSSAERKQIMENSRKFNEFLYYLTSGYLEKQDASKVTEDAIKAVLAELDPHSTYISKEELKEVSQAFDGNFEGIGIEFNVLHDTIVVVNPIKGGPSESVGLKSGDRIVKVDDKLVLGVTQMDVPKILRGPKGTVIKLDVVRAGEKEPLQFTITRDKIPMHSLDASFVIDDSIGYVKLNRFMSTTTEEFESAMQAMPGIKSLILDLRGNTGGYLDQAIRLSNEFLDNGKLIVYTEGRVVPRQDDFADSTGLFLNGRLAVLVDEESASASEIVAGAIQDHDRGVIVGRPTFGKGLVQQQIPLSDSSAIRLTVAKYFTPSGRAIQRAFKMGDARAYYTDYYKRYTTGELISHDSLKKMMPDSLKAYTSRLGRTVYGGGGINPDVFVGMDTTGYSKSWSAMIRANVISDYVVGVVDKNRKQMLKKYPDFEKFNRDYEIPEEFVEGLIAHAKNKGVTVDAADLSKTMEKVKLQLKALVAQKLWDFNEFYRVILKEDNELQKAIEVLHNPESRYLYK